MKVKNNKAFIVTVNMAALLYLSPSTVLAETADSPYTVTESESLNMIQAAIAVDANDEDSANGSEVIILSEENNDGSTVTIDNEQAVLEQNLPEINTSAVNNDTENYSEELQASEAKTDTSVNANNIDDIKTLAEVNITNSKLGAYVPTPTTDFLVNVKDSPYSAVGDGQTDDTAAIQKAIDDAAATGGGIVDIPAGTYLIDTVKYLIDPNQAYRGGLQLKSNVTLRMADDTVLQAIPNGDKAYALISIFNADNAHVIGGTLIGDRGTHTSQEGQTGYGVRIAHATNVVVENVTAKEFWGDGFFVSEGHSRIERGSENITFYRVVSDHNRRQGLSIISGKNIKILNSEFSNADGTDPRAGIDIEPDKGADQVSNVEIRDSVFTGNYFGLTVGNHWPGASIKNVTFVNNTLKDNKVDVNLVGLEGGLIADNTIYNDHSVNQYNPDYRIHYGIRLQNGTHTATQNVTVRDNTIYGGNVIDSTGNNTVENNKYKASVYIRGIAHAGQTLTAQVYDGDYGETDAHKAVLVPSSAISYQWFADGVAIDGATQSTYVPTDTDSGKVITVQVQFTDKAGNAETAFSAATQPVNYTNSAPISIYLSPLVIHGDTYQAELAGNLKTTDPDANDTHTYTVSDSRFEIIHGNGLRLKEGEYLNYATEKSVPLMITATDPFGASYSQTFTLEVIPSKNIAPQEITLSSDKLAEGQTGAIVGQLTTLDRNVDDTHTYTVSDVRFEVTADGILKLKENEKVEYVNEESITLQVTAADKANRIYTKTFVLQVQDEPSYPIIPQSDNENGDNTETEPCDASETATTTSIVFSRSDMGNYSDDPAIPYIGEWGTTDPAYIEQAEIIKNKGGRKFLPYVNTVHGLVNYPEIAEELGITNAADYTKEFILNEIATAKKIYDDLMDGVFLDTFTSGLGNWWRPTVPWYKDLVDSIREIYGEDFFIVGNPGEKVSDEVLNLDVDVLITFEGTAEKYLTSDVHPDNMALAHADSSRLWHVVYNITKDNINDVLAKADSMNIDHLWLSDGEIINGPRRDGMPAQSPYKDVPSDWVIEAMIEWQNKKMPSGDDLENGSRYISPISYWNPDSLDYADRHRYENILKLTDRLGIVLMNHYEGLSWNIKDIATLRYQLSWSGFEDEDTDLSNYMYRIKVPTNVKVQSYTDIKWEDGLDGYFYAPAQIGSKALWLEYNGTDESTDPWTIEFDIVDKETKEPICNKIGSSLTHNVAWIEYSNIDENTTSDDTKATEDMAGNEDADKTIEEQLKPSIESSTSADVTVDTLLTEETQKSSSKAIISAENKTTIQVASPKDALLITAKNDSKKFTPAVSNSKLRKFEELPNTGDSAEKSSFLTALIASLLLFFNYCIFIAKKVTTLFTKNQR